MKKVLFIVVWLFSSLLQAQDSTQSFTIAQYSKVKPKSDINYFTLYLGNSPFSGGHIESIFYKNWGLGISYEFKPFATANVPQPYVRGLFSSEFPYDFSRIASLNIIRKIPMTNRDK